MIRLLLGTPGSGKSLNMARMIFSDLKPGKDLQVITNVPLNLNVIPEESRKRYTYISNEELQDASCLVRYAEKYWASHYAKNHADGEHRLHLYIDECQILFNARDWQKNKDKFWPTFFSVHRHYGFYIVLVTQMMSSIDKQVRGVIEYYTVHRKVSNFGLFGWVVSNLLFRGRLFVTVECWAPLNEKIDSGFFLYRKKLGKIYNTHALFGLDGTINQNGIIRYLNDKKDQDYSYLENDDGIIKNFTEAYEI